MTEANPRVVLLVHQAAELYGSDKVLIYLASGLLRGKRWQPVVVVPTPGPLIAVLQDLGIEVHVAEVAKISRSAFSPAGLVRLLMKCLRSTAELDRVIAGRTVAVVHSNTLAVLAGAVWAWRRRVKHLWHVHEIIRSPKLVSRAYPLLVRASADCVVSNSTLTQQWLLSEQPALAGRSKVVFNGLPPQEQATQSDGEQFRQRVGAGPQDVLVVLAGRLNHWKGQTLLIAAAALMRERGQLANVRLAIVGDPAPGQEHLRAELEAKAHAAGLADRLRFIGFVDDIRPIWRAADIAVVPSTEPEPFGMVAIEAMAAGVPVIAAAHGGLLDIVVHGETGLLLEPRDAEALANALHHLAMNPEERHRLGEAGRARQLQLFSVDSQVVAFEDLYASMA